MKTPLVQLTKQRDLMARHESQRGRNEKRASHEGDTRCIYWRRAMARRYNRNAI